jgi:hypothetical protein
VKPFRGKRRGPQSRRAGFNLPAARRSRRRHLLAGVASRSDRAAAGALSARRAPRPVRWRSEAFGEGGRRLGDGVIDPDRVGPPADRGRPTRPASGLVPVRPTDWRGLSSVPFDCGRSAGGSPGAVLGVCGESVGNLSDPS